MSASRDLLAALVLHHLGVIGWLGGLFMVGWVLALRDGEADPGFKTRMGVMARRLALVADVGAALAIAGGAYLLIKQREFLFHQRWMLIKLAVVVVIIGLHGLIRVKAKRASQGEGTFPKIVLQVLVIALGAVLYLVVFKP